MISLTNRFFKLWLLDEYSSSNNNFNIRFFNEILIKESGIHKNLESQNVVTDTFHTIFSL